MNVTISTGSQHWVPCTQMLDALGVAAVDDVIYGTKANPTVKLNNLNDKPLHIHSHLGIGALFQETNQLAEDSLAPLTHDVDPTDDPVEELTRRTEDTVEPEYRSEVRSLIERNKDLFVGPNNPLGRTHLVQHEIHTGDAAPIRQPLRRRLIGRLLIRKWIECCVKVS